MLNKLPFVIAEAGVNHNGSLDLARRLIDAAKDAGADAVKFQSFKSKKLASSLAPKAAYQQCTTGDSQSQLEMISKFELSDEAHFQILEHCNSVNIELLSTPFDEDSLKLVVEHLRIKRLKVSSGEITNAPLLLAMAKYKLPIILSTGMATLGDIEAALGVLAFGLIEHNKQPSRTAFTRALASSAGQQAIKETVTLLHCTTEYPAPLAEVNLRVMRTLREAFGLDVGYSDHSKGITVPIAAAALDAKIIEKHFTLDRTMPGPDHSASIEPHELKTMVSCIRDVALALGSPIKYPTPSEWTNRNAARKSIVASKPILEGELLSELNLTTKRPGNGLSPFSYWAMLGRQARRAYEFDEIITEEFNSD